MAQTIYILATDFCPDHIHANEIQNWTHYANQHNKLTEDAKAFCNLANLKGMTYDMDDFQFALNTDSADINDSFIFITNLNIL